VLEMSMDRRIIKYGKNGENNNEKSMQPHGK